MTEMLVAGQGGRREAEEGRGLAFEDMSTLYRRTYTRPEFLALMEGVRNGEPARVPHAEVPEVALPAVASAFRPCLSRQYLSAAHRSAIDHMKYLCAAVILDL